MTKWRHGNGNPWLLPKLLGFHVTMEMAKKPWHFLLGQWLNFKLFGITYLVGKIKFKLLF